MIYRHLEGIPFEYGKRDCWWINSEAYRDNWGIHLTNFARPDFWWLYGIDMYRELAPLDGFQILDVPRDLQVGDILLIPIRSEVPNHSALYLGNGMILNHIRNRTSKAIPYKGFWKSATCALLRHPDVPVEEPEVKEVNLIDFLLPHKRRMVEELVEGA